MSASLAGVPAVSYVYRSRDGGVWSIDGCSLRELTVTRGLRGYGEPILAKQVVDVEAPVYL